MTSVPDRANAGEGRELWGRASFLVAGLVLSGFVALGLRLGAPLAPWLYLRGFLILFALAAIVLIWGIVRGLRRPPFLGHGRRLAFALCGLSIVLASLPFPYPSSHAGGFSPVDFRLPFDGAWSVRWGGERRTENALVFSPPHRYGFAFVPGPEASTEVLAPANGRVLAVGAASGERGGGPTEAYLVLEVAAERCLVLANLSSVTVELGAVVEAGSVLGSVAEGEALLVHLQDDPRPGRGEGVPLRFRDYLSGGREVEAGVPRGGPAGETVAPAAGP